MLNHVHGLILGDNSLTYAVGEVKSYCNSDLGDGNNIVSVYDVTLRNILIVPTFIHSLLSARKTDKQGWTCCVLYRKKFLFTTN